MFGYVRINKPELKVREYETYRGYYCGLCGALKKAYGKRGQLTLTYDMTFLTILLTGLYEPVSIRGKKGCFLHPAERHLFIQNEITAYAADMNLAFSYLKLLDNWRDERSHTGLMAAGFLKKDFRAVRNRYPEKMDRILKSMKKLKECEQKKESMPDIPAGCFGEVTAELFLYREDQWKDILYRMGYFLGKYIYLADAYEDVEEDFKNQNYNVFLSEWKDRRSYPVIGEDGRASEAFYREGHEILMLMMAECAKEFEKLPIIKNAELLRNILYAGVWTRNGGKGRQ